MRKFDYSFLENGLLPANLINLTTNIYSLRKDSDYKKLKHKNIFTELEKVAKVQSIKSSNAIEGIITTDKRIMEIVNNNSHPLNHDEIEIAGYRDALNMIHNSHKDIEFVVQDILKIHQIIYSNSDIKTAGKYKVSNNLIVEVDSYGYKRIRFKPTDAKDTPKAMQQLELAYNEARNNANINQLLLIPCVILDFLCIHPFSDGNGRVSRLLSILLLYKASFDIVKYISYEEQINNYKEMYYEALKLSSYGWEDNNNDYIPFIKNFLSMLYMCYKELNKRFAVIGDVKINKTTRIEATVLNSLVPISKNEICKILPDISVSTIEKILGEMIKKDRIKKIGKGRATRYIRNE